MISQTNKRMTGKDTILDEEKITIYNSNLDTLPHQHDFVEIVYFKEGVGSHVIEGETFEIGSGCICLINTSVQHYYRINDTLSGKGISVKNCIFYADFLGENISSEHFIQDFWEYVFQGAIPAPSANFLQINKDYNRDYSTLLSMIEYEIRTKKANYLEVIKNCLSNILIRMFRDHLESSEKPQLSTMNSELIERALEYIDSRYNEDITVAECAKYTGFSPAYFNRLFKAYTKYTFRKYLQKLRCEKACALLRNTDMSIQSVCGEVGYSDFKQFYLLFKKYIGTTPKNYRTTAPVHDKEPFKLHKGLPPSKNTKQPE
ncbi:MAG: helix-turn-helix transcriptional regulator [Clostridia bacterium]|nr:helix-turn-helix transcriptional regulator [Clostridia bacterium]